MLAQENIQPKHSINVAALHYTPSFSLAEVAELADCDKLRAAAREEESR